MSRAPHFDLYLLLLLGSCSCTYSDWESKWQILCPALYPRVFTSYTPRGNLTGGIFSRQSHLSEMRQCVASCCQEPTCHVALVYNVTCYHVQCTRTQLCTPLYRPDLAKKSPPQMVLVKPVREDEAWSDFLDQDNDASGYGMRDDIVEINE